MTFLRFPSAFDLLAAHRARRLAILSQEAAKAQAAYDAAKERGDTRAQNYAHKALRVARHALLQAEAGR